MPYIKEDDRDALEGRFSGAGADRVARAPLTVGELNYCITRTCLDWLISQTFDRKVTYADYNAVIGALEAAKLEFYRRACAPYEDGKIAENGDVY